MPATSVYVQTATIESQHTADLRDRERVVATQPLPRGRLPPGQRIAVAPDLLDFGELEVGTSVREMLRVSNFGFSELKVTGVASTLPEFSTYFACDRLGSATSCPSIPPYGSLEVPVVFSATRPGVFSADLVIESDDPQQPELTVPLLGRSAPAISVTP
jgi:hypothetical protein